jgi:hypothetical protein
VGEDGKAALMAVSDTFGFSFVLFFYFSANNSEVIFLRNLI